MNLAQALSSVTPRPVDTTARSVRRLVVLGSTGSIGTSTLEVVEHLNQAAQTEGHPVVRVVGLAAGNRVEKLIEQARRLGVEKVAVADAARAGLVVEQLPGVEVFSGPESAEQLVRACDADEVSSAVVGSAGLAATLAAIERGWTVHLANKETLVAAGELVSRRLAESRSTLIPVDSEHSAIFQCLQGRSLPHLRRVVLTASGGPFRTWTREKMRKATPEEALCHPTWNMGTKITIDSATMMNKALEVIEAHWLFGLSEDQIEVIIHPQSIVHSFVEFADHSVLAQMGPPDMKTPIQYALTWPERTCGSGPEMDWQSLRSLNFEPVDRERFPSIDLAYDVVRRGGTSGAVMNAANEAAVGAFLDHRICFGAIFDLVAEAMQAVPTVAADSLEAVMAADAEARRWVETRIGRGA